MIIIASCIADLINGKGEERAPTACNKIATSEPKIVALKFIAAGLIFAAMGVARGSIYNSCAYAFWSGLIIVSLYMLSSLRLGDRVRATAS